MPERPLGVTIICILQWIGAIIGIVGGVILALLGLAIPNALILALGVIVLVVGLVAFFVTFGLWKLRSWAFWLTIIVNIISIVSSIGAALFGGGASAFGGLIIPLIVVIYLFTVREHFK